MNYNYSTKKQVLTFATVYFKTKRLYICMMYFEQFYKSFTLLIAKVWVLLKFNNYENNNFRTSKP